MAAEGPFATLAAINAGSVLADRLGVFRVLAGRVMPAATGPCHHIMTKWQSPACSALDTARDASPAPTGQSLTGPPAGPGEVHRRSTGGQSLHVTASHWQRLLTRRPSTRLVRSVTIFSTVPGAGNAPSSQPRWQGILRNVSAAGRTTIAHVCSMFARMSRYGPVAAGITRHPLPWLAVQSGRLRHVPAHNDTRQRSKIEQSSGLLICGHIGPVAGSPMAI